MSIHQTFRGAAPVGYLSELPPLELAAIVYFRMTCASQETRDQLSKDFALAFGTEHGSIYEGLLADFVQVLAQKSRRRIMRHEPNCKCFGGDESAIANMIAAAAGGDREEAQLLAANLVPCEIANQLVGPAEDIGLALHLMLERFPNPVFSQSLYPRTKH
jgi:hypothetical protein